MPASSAAPATPNACPRRRPETEPAGPGPPRRAPRTRGSGSTGRGSAGRRSGGVALSARCSYGFHQAVDERLIFDGAAVIAHLAVDDDATPEAVDSAIALSDNVGRHRRQRRDDREGPRQRRSVDAMRLAVLVEVVDVHAAPRPRDLVCRPLLEKKDEHTIY